MATRGTVSPKADQPRVSTSSLRETSAPANLQYRVQGIKTFTGRDTSKTGRELGRG